AVERRQPFVDLISMIHPRPVNVAVDLGCGTGELTRSAADELGCASMIGVDNSPAMLAGAGAFARDGVRFEPGDIATWATSQSGLDLVLANASLQWVPDHAGTLRCWTRSLRPGGQLAVQVPANANMASHTVAQRVANSKPFLGAFGEDGPPRDPVADNVLEPQDYASLLFDLGFVEQHVRLQVYPHVLASSRSVVEWVSGTTLTRFQRRLEPALFAAFLVEYERALIDVIGDHAPYFFPFRRILLWGRLGEP
ncbi:MAG: methyltransferase domain-containing protein, partial [Ilumatobacteraceae bacterium]